MPNIFSGGNRSNVPLPVLMRCLMTDTHNLANLPKRFSFPPHTDRYTRLAWMEVYLGHNLRKAGGDLEKLWLVIDWPQGQEKAYHYYLAHLHRSPQRAPCLKMSRSRWQTEQY